MEPINRTVRRRVSSKRYRVREEGDKLYPQRKICFIFWADYKVVLERSRVLGLPITQRRIFFDTVADATKFLDQETARRAGKRGTYYSYFEKVE